MKKGSTSARLPEFSECNQVRPRPGFQELGSALGTSITSESDAQAVLTQKFWGRNQACVFANILTQSNRQLWLRMTTNILEKTKILSHHSSTLCNPVPVLDSLSGRLEWPFGVKVGGKEQCNHPEGAKLFPSERDRLQAEGTKTEQLGANNQTKGSLCSFCASTLVAKFY